jgi:hypothetical protein
MEEYILMNQFTERYRSKERRNMRSTEVLSLVIESLVLKKKRERERDEEGGTHETFYRQKGTIIDVAL